MSQEGSKPVGTLDSHIEVTPGTCGGRARIAGHRIRVQDIVLWCERIGESADEVVARYPQLSLADVYAALAYYHDRREEIEAEMATDDRFINEMRSLYPTKIKSTHSTGE